MGREDTVAQKPQKPYFMINLSGIRHKSKRLVSLNEVWFRGIQQFYLLGDKYFLKLPELDLVSEALPRGIDESERPLYIDKNSQKIGSMKDVVLRIINGEIEIFGAKCNFGTCLPWKKDFINGVDITDKFFYNVPFLNKDCVGDSKVVWELNRLQFLVPVAKAYFLFENPSYYQWLKATIIDWINTNVYPMGINWASSLELAFRVVTFDWVIRFCRNSLLQDDDFRCAILKLLYVHGRHISRYLSTYFSPNTHLSGEGLALYLLGVRYPFLPDARKWREIGWKTLLKCLDFQILTDGGYFERSLWYHRYTIEVYLLFSFLAREASDPLPAIVWDKLDCLLTFMLHALRGDGTFPLIGDDDGGRLIALDSLDPGDVRGLMAACAVYLRRGDLKAVADDCTEAVWWLWGQKGINEYEALTAQELQKAGAVFPETGHAFLRSGWEGDGTLVSMDAGPLGARNCGHSHSDALSLTLSVGNRNIIIDPGTYTYTLDIEKRNYFRSMEAHSSPYILGLPLSIPSDSPFQWLKIQQPCRFTQSSVGWEMDMITGVCEGNSQSGVLVAISRKVLFLKPRNLLFVWDFFKSGDGNAAVSQLLLDGGGWIISPKGAISAAPALVVDIQAVGDVPLEVLLDPVDVSPAYLQKTKGCRLQFKRAGKLPGSIVTVIRWGKERSELELAQGSASSIKVQSGDETIRCFVAVGEKTQSGDKIDTDASAVCVVERDGSVDKAWALNVSRLIVGSKTLLNSNQVIKRWNLM